MAQLQYTFTLGDRVIEKTEMETDSFADFALAYAAAIKAAKEEVQYGTTALIEAVIFNTEVRVEFYRDKLNQVQYIES